MAGKTVYVNNDNKNYLSYNLENLSSGVYQIVLKTNSEIYNKKMIIK